MESFIMRLMPDGQLEKIGCEKTISYEKHRELIGGGWLECTGVGELPDIDIWLDEEGKLKGFAPTLGLSENGEMFDFAVGPVVFTRCNDDGETIPLQETDIPLIEKYVLVNRIS